MTPMFPDPLAIFLGGPMPPIGSVIDGTVMLVLAVLLVPWALLGLAAGGDFLQHSRRRQEPVTPSATTTAPLREAA